MGKIDLGKIVDSSKKFLSKRSPEIMIGIGIALGISSTVSAVKATPKALTLIEERKLDLNEEELSPIEIVRTTWPCYIFPAITGLMSVFFIVGSNSIHSRRNAAIATAYTLSEAALTEYKGKVIETLGEKKERLVRDAIAKERIEKDPVAKKEVIITDRGDSLCYEPLSGRYFKSDIEKIRRAINEINQSLLFDSYISLNDFYEKIGLEETKLGYDLGWNIDQSLIEVDFSSQLASDGTPCLVMDFVKPPVYNYNKWL